MKTTQIEALKIKIKSDFWDYYDHHACSSQEASPDYVLERYSRNGPSKPQQFKILESLGLEVPLHGRVPQVIKQLHQREDQDSVPLLVIYDDEDAHAGEGKNLLAFYHAASTENADKYCSLFVPTTLSIAAAAQSWRLLWVGDLLFKIQYTGIGDWRSNAAQKVNICVMDQEIDWLPAVDRRTEPLRSHPLVAIDFVCPYGECKPLAIDLNISPGLLHTGVEKILSPKACYEAIRAYIASTLSC